MSPLSPVAADPRVTARVPHSRPTLPAAAEWAEVTGRLDPVWVAGGPCAEAFGREAAAWLGASDGVAVNSGTSALHLALLAVGVEAGTEVLLPSYCCTAVLNAVRLAGAVPVLVDAEPGGFNLCPRDVHARLTSRTRAVVVAHMFGDPAPLEPFLGLGVPVVEDCSQSFGARAGEAITGAAGAVAICSFYATKVITTGHGGVVASRDPERLARVRDLVHHDQRDDWRPRFNYLMSELPAALGLWQLARLPGFLERRRALARYYDEQLGARHVPRPVSTIHYRYVLRANAADPLMAALDAEGVDSRRPVYRPLHHYVGGVYPHAQVNYEQVVSLPLYPALTDGEAERVVDAVRALDARLFR